jgi:predicted transcriptional regulator
MDAIDELKDQYKAKRLTQSGLILAAIDELMLGEIDIVELADVLELPYSSVRDNILRLRKAGHIHIPTRKGKRSTS